MISKKHLCNKLKQIGYTYDDELHFSERWRKKGAGGTDPIHIPKKKNVDEEAAKLILASAGCTKDDIEDFIRCSKS